MSQAREGLVMGVISASVIWMLAAIGPLVGFGRYSAATIPTGVRSVVPVSGSMVR